MKRPSLSFFVCLLAAMALDFARAADPPPRIWILPFENHRADSSLDYLEEALPALLAEALSGSDDYALVDRQYFNLVLSEQSLTLQGLTSPDTRLRMGRLLGATVMITGSFAEQGQDLLIMIRALDLRTGIVTVTAEARGPVSQLGQLVGKLYGRLASGLDRRLPDLAPEQIDPAPLSNLHFLKGLGHYFSARYNQALAEFLLAAEESELKDISRLWLANAYLAQEQYGHAYFELSRLGNFRESEIAAKRAVCEKYLSAEEGKMIRELAFRHDAG